MDSSNKEKPEFTLTKISEDIILSLWANVTGKSQPFKKVDFTKMQCGIPRL
jgi:hypothetical protein